MRKDRLIREKVHDPYKSRSKLPEPTVCPHCGAVFMKGRWQWAPAEPDAHQTPCPACQRIHDKCPAGYLSLAGDFFKEHRDEILHLARNVEDREKAQHPLRRTMAIDDQDDGVLITTTEMEFARTLGDAIHHAYHGDLDYQYTDEANILRVRWKR